MPTPRFARHEDDGAYAAVELVDRGPQPHELVVSLEQAIALAIFAGGRDGARRVSAG